MQTFRYAYFPADVCTVHVALFADVANAAAVRARIIRASITEGQEGEHEREAVNFAFVDARLISSPLHLQTAIVQAILAHVQGTLRTKTIHSEILWALSPNNNITEAIRRFGVSDSTTALLVIRIASPEFAPERVLTSMQAVVSGSLVSITRLREITDWTAIKKYYRVDADPAIKVQGMDSEKERAVVNEIVVSAVAMKSVM
ncbi:CGI-121-domain-containing protein, partial [Laetiporus sulphureus 93-53]